MNYKSKNVIICVCSFIISLIIWLGCVVIFNDYCYENINDTITGFLMLFAPIVFSSSFLLLFLREEIFRSWQKFAIIWVPISILLIARAPAQRDCFFGGPFCYGLDREGMIWFTAGIFFIVSLIIIAVKSWKLRGK